MRKAARQRHLHYFSNIGAGVIEYRFESWVRCDKLSVLRSSECFRAEFKNFSGTVPEQDLIVSDAVQLRKLINQYIIVLVWIAAGEAE